MALRAPVRLAWLLGLLLWCATPARAAEINVLSNASITPAAGTTATPFTFSVHYASSAGHAAGSVTVDVAGQAVALGLVAGTADDGTFSGSSQLPAGTWPVTFRADPLTGPAPAPVTAGEVTVTPDGTPTAVPTSTPGPTVTAGPTATPGATATPRPTATGTRLPAGSAPATAPASTAASPIGSPTPSSTGPPSPAESVSPAPSDEPSAEASAERGEPAPSGSLRGPLLALGGGLTATGAAVLGVQYARLRGRRRGGP